jgi:hypothetical protein
MDIFNGRAQKAGSFRVISYNYGPATGTGSKSEVWREWLVADRRVSPGDSVAFRIDFSSWLDRLPERRRRTAELLAEGYGTGEVARKLGISAAAVSQARLWLEKSWREFQGELPGVASSRPLHLVPGSA